MNCIYSAIFILICFSAKNDCAAELMGLAMDALRDASSPAALCPQAYWDSLMKMHIIVGNATASVNGIHAGFRTRYPGRPFFVTCFERKVNEEKDKPTNVHLSASGNRYCVVIKDNIWCQAVAQVVD